jgi:hypothetical protein
MFLRFLYNNKMHINKVISGGQTGADLGGLAAAKNLGIETGGTMPKGFLTELGPKPILSKIFNLQESHSDKYVPRTFQNAKDSDGTIRFAKDFNSPGEKCTLKAIKQYKKPFIDIDIFNPIDYKEVIDWMVENRIYILNVAGNRESTSPGIFVFVKNYLMKVLQV